MDIQLTQNSGTGSAAIIDCRYPRWLARRCLILVMALAALAPVLHAASAHAAQLRGFSGWLNRDAIPELQQLLAQHPRYQGQRVQIASETGNGLSEAVTAALNTSLAGQAGVLLVADGQISGVHAALPGSIDELDCRGSPRFDYLLRVSAAPVTAAQARVQIELLEASGAGERVHNWHWRGSLSAVQRQQLERAADSVVADGSLNAPWKAGDVDAAARSLSHGFACALRPQVVTRLGLQWPQDTSLPALFADTANTSRHLLGSYHELGIEKLSPDYSVTVRVQPFRQDTWQMWLTGTPRKSDLAAVQAVTYFKATDPGAQRGTPPPPAAKALDFIQVQVLDATQTDSGRARAELQVTLRIGNLADWPIAYAFTLSGGHFNHCIAQPDYYRHDHYGHLAGDVAAGASVVRRLVIENTQHQPTPWFGMRKCAGFRDLESFEQFTSQGHKVTDFVRWDM